MNQQQHNNGIVLRFSYFHRIENIIEKKNHESYVKKIHEQKKTTHDYTRESIDSFTAPKKNTATKTTNNKQTINEEYLQALTKKNLQQKQQTTNKQSMKTEEYLQALAKKNDVRFTIVSIPKNID